MATKCNKMSHSPALIKAILGPLGKLGYLWMAVFPHTFLLLMDLSDELEHPITGITHENM